jgi:hypothetical protein
MNSCSFFILKMQELMRNLMETVSFLHDAQKVGSGRVQLQRKEARSRV